MKITHKEHSIILYLIDALKAQPENYRYIFNLAKSLTPASLDYYQTLDRLEKNFENNTFSAASIKLRKELL